MELKPSVLEHWTSSCSKISEPELRWNREKPPKNRETELEPQKTAKNRRFGTVVITFRKS